MADTSQEAKSIISLGYQERQEEIVVSRNLKDKKMLAIQMGIVCACLHGAHLQMGRLMSWESIALLSLMYSVPATS